MTMVPTYGVVPAMGYGTFKRQEQAFRHWITPDGTAGPTGSAGYAAQANRYHLTVGLACPWAHRVLIMRA